MCEHKLQELHITGPNLPLLGQIKPRIPVIWYRYFTELNTAATPVPRFSLQNDVVQHAGHTKCFVSHISVLLLFDNYAMLFTTISKSL